MIKICLVIAAGGAIGAVARHLVYVAAEQIYTLSHLPLGTFIVNITGSFFIGIVYYLFHAGFLNQESKHLISTGFLGGFTTFSTFSMDNVNLLRKEEWTILTVNILANTIVGIMAAAAGFFLARLIWNR